MKQMTCEWQVATQRCGHVGKRNTQKDGRPNPMQSRSSDISDFLFSLGKSVRRMSDKSCPVPDSIALSRSDSPDFRGMKKGKNVQRVNEGFVEGNKCCVEGKFLVFAGPFFQLREAGLRGMRFGLLLHF
jgi:hypothetical protein